MQPIRPSETQDYLRCPRYWYWKHVEGWEAPPSAWTPERLLGTAVHAGLAEYWRNKRHRIDPWDKQYGWCEPNEALRDRLAEEWPLDAPPEYNREEYESLALKVLDAVLQWIAQEMPHATPVLVEQALGPDGHTTPDLVTREAGQLVVTDWKTSWNVPADRVRYRLEGAERDHQFLHYCWAVGEHLGEPVKLFRKVVIVGSPKIIVKDVTFQPDPQAIEYWLTGALQIWKDMGNVRAGERVAPQNPNGCKMYGDKYPCPYYEACWTCHGDPERMRQFLVRR